MKRSLLALPLACLFVLPLAATATTAVVKKPGAVSAQHAKPKTKAKPPVTAPADEYFGHQKYSILGIRNALHDLNIRYDGTIGRTPFLYSNGAGLEDAMHDWDKKYHGDLWLAHYLFQLDQIYMRVPPDLGHQKVDSVSRWIIGAYPNTYYGKYLIHIRKLHPYVAKATAAPSAMPTSAGTILPVGGASATPSPVPSMPAIELH